MKTILLLSAIVCLGLFGGAPASAMNLLGVDAEQTTGDVAGQAHAGEVSGAQTSDGALRLVASTRFGQRPDVIEWEARLERHRDASYEIPFVDYEYPAGSRKWQRVTDSSSGFAIRGRGEVVDSLRVVVHMRRASRIANMLPFTRRTTELQVKLRRPESLRSLPEPLRFVKAYGPAASGMFRFRVRLDGIARSGLSVREVVYRLPNYFPRPVERRGTGADFETVGVTANEFPLKAQVLLTDGRLVIQTLIVDGAFAGSLTVRTIPGRSTHPAVWIEADPDDLAKIESVRYTPADKSIPATTVRSPANSFAWTVQTREHSKVDVEIRMRSGRVLRKDTAINTYVPGAY